MPLCRPVGSEPSQHTYAQNCDCELEHVDGTRKSDEMYNAACECTGKYAKFKNGFPSESKEIGLTTRVSVISQTFLLPSPHRLNDAETTQ
jgi:hypothetical protein